MRRSFTIIELIVVIVILGILSTFAIDVITRVYKNYYYTKEFNKLLSETDYVINFVASKLSNRVRNSVIAVECNVSNDDCIKGNVKGFLPLSSVTDAIRENYPVLEWIGKDIYSRRGMWSDDLKRVVPGYSTFVDLKKTEDKQNDTYIIYTPYSHFDLIKEIDSNWTKEWGIEGDVFKDRLEVLIFAGADDRGDFLDINNSYGYYDGNATRVFEINESESNFSINKIYIKAIDKSDSTTVYEKYYMVNSAYAIVPSCNKDSDGNCIDYNLTIFFNYYPWKHQKYFDVDGGSNEEDDDANNSLMISHVTQFRFREDAGLVRLYICISNPKVKIDGEPMQVCKEKVVF